MNEQSSGEHSNAHHPSLKPVSDLFKTAWEQYQQHASVLIGIMLISGIGLYIQSILLFASPAVTVNRYGQMSASGFAGFGILSLIAAVIAIVGAIWGYSALLNRISKLSQPMGIKESYMSAKPLIWPLFLTGLLVAILTIIGFVLVIIPGIIVAVFLSFSLYIVIDEHKKGVEALKASKAYVDGYWLPIFGRIFAMGLAVVVVMIILGAITGMIFDYKIGSLVQNVLGMVVTPFAVLYMYNLYHNVKQVKGGSAPVAHI